ncbi:hypothetical protein [Enterobacter soli]|uniref:hypothetical protein n=1 Tax=Enterobacter soli TaxID=885040 RepID=UPI002F404014
MVKTIDQIANEYFGGNLKRMAIANDMQPSLLSRNKAAGWLVVNGVLMSPRRQLVDSEGQPICGKTK